MGVGITVGGRQASAALVVMLVMFATTAGRASAQSDMPGMDHPAPDCALVRAALPPELAGWSNRVAASAAGDKAALGKAMLTVGQAVDATLLRTADVRYVVRPEKPGGSVSYGGLFAFSVTAPGTYRVALGSGAWIDMLRKGRAVASTAHGHGPDCSGVRKMVDFPLTPGRYVLQLAANGAQSLPVMVVRLP